MDIKASTANAHLRQVKFQLGSYNLDIRNSSPITSFIQGFFKANNLTISEILEESQTRIEGEAEDLRRHSKGIESLNQ